MPSQGIGVKQGIGLAQYGTQMPSQGSGVVHGMVLPQ
jgi:hypothetical protein